jgi:hypothetical protein
MYLDNKWRIVNCDDPNAHEFFKMLFRHGLQIFKYPFKSIEMQAAIDQVFPDELFFQLLSSNRNKIPMMGCGGPFHSTRVIEKLRESKFFRDYFDAMAFTFDRGVFGKFFVSSYDGSIPRSLPSTSRTLEDGPRPSTRCKVETAIAIRHDTLQYLKRRKSLSLDPGTENHITSLRIFVEKATSFYSKDLISLHQKLGELERQDIHAAQMRARLTEAKANS